MAPGVAAAGVTQGRAVMNVETAKIGWLVALGAVLLLAGPPAMAQKKPGGGTDPCATAIGFPAFIYWQQSAKSQQIFVADETGRCSRPVVKVSGSGGAGAARFSMVNPNRGRVVFPDIGGVVSAVDFTVSGTTISVGPKRPVAQWGCCSLDLSSDGLRLYVPTEMDTANGTTLQRISLVDGSIERIRTLQSPWHFVGISADATGAVIYTDEEEMPGLGKRLMRVDVSGTTTAATQLVSGNGVAGANYYPAADTANSRFAYAYSLAGLDRCFEVRVASSDGTPAAPLAPTRYGTRLTWMSGNILATDRKPPDGTGRCADTGNIARISPDGTESAVLVRGYDPDAR